MEIEPAVKEIYELLNQSDGLSESKLEQLKQFLRAQAKAVRDDPACGEQIDRL